MRQVLMLIMLSLHAVAAMGQKITGWVKNISGEPIAFADIALVDHSDTSYVSITMSDADGLFSIFVPEKKGLSIRVSAVGYESGKVSCDSIDCKNRLTVVLKEKQLSLDGVTVTAHPPKTQLKGNVLVTHVADNALSKLGTARKVLAKIPGLIEQNGKIGVFGKGKLLIYINDKKVRDEEELSLLPADKIKDIEVANTPGAGYDAEVSTVVRIVTLKSDKGLGLNLRTDNEWSRYYTGNQQIDINLRKEKIELTGTLHLKEEKDRSVIHAKQTTYTTNMWELNSSNKSFSRTYDYSGRIGIAFTPNDKQSFGMSYRYEKNKDRGTLINQSTVSKEGSVYDQLESTGTQTDCTVPSHEMNVYYKGAWGKFDIDFNADYLYSKSTDAQRQEETSLNFEDRSVTTLYGRHNRLLAEKLVVSIPFMSGNFSVGEEFSFTERRNSFFNLEEILNNSSNVTRERNTSVFAEQSLKFGKVVTDVGIRYENVVATYEADAKRSKTYRNFFPSFTLSAPLGGAKVSLGYSMTTTRPAYSQLDGNISYINRFHYLTGNPLLQPVRRSNVTAGITYKWMYFSGSFTHSANEIIYCSQPLADDPEVVMVSYKNFDHLDKLVLYCSLSPRISIWKPTVNIGYVQQWFEAEYKERTKSFNKPIVLLQFRNVLELPHEILFNLDADYQSRGNNQNMMLNDQFRINFRIGKSFLCDKLNLRIDLNDCLDTYQFKPSLYSSNILIRQENVIDTRSILFSLSYRLNAAKSRYKGSGAGNNEKGRL